MLQFCVLLFVKLNFISAAMLGLLLLLQISALPLRIESWRLQRTPYHHRRVPSPPLLQVSNAGAVAAQKAAEMLSKMSSDAVRGMKPGEKIEMKDFVSSVKIKHTRSVKAMEGGGVPDYMRLPIDQYAIYDARLMRRLPESEVGEDDGAIFEFRLPMVRPSDPNAFVPKPKVLVRVRSTEESISIESVSASLFDEVDTLPPNLTADNLSAMSNLRKQLFNLDFNTTLAWRPSRKRKAAQGDTDITATTRVGLKLAMPPPFTKMPRPLVQGAIGIIMRFVGGAILPQFSALLERDYQRWCNGTRGELSAGFGSLNIDDEGFIVVPEKMIQQMQKRDPVLAAKFEKLQSLERRTSQNLTDDEVLDQIDDILNVSSRAEAKIGDPNQSLM